MNGQDLAKVVTSDYRYQWSEGTWQIDNGWGRPGMRHLDAYPYRVVAWDFGIKENILRLLADRGIKVTVVPAQTTF